MHVVNDFGEMVIPNMLYEQSAEGFVPIHTTGLDVSMSKWVFLNLI